MKNTISLALALTLATLVSAQGLKVHDKPWGHAVDLSSAAIMFDKNDATVVGKSAGLLSDDIARVCRRNTSAKSREAVIVGTVGQSSYIDRLVKQGKLDVSAIKGGWERYIVKTIEKPMKGIDRAVLVAGSDRRGTAYGVFAVSEAIGVSPWYWWADVPVIHSDGVFVEADTVSQAPSVKYRGIFINDEDWGLKPWSSFNYEKELGDIGPKTYARVCELLLRLKGNMLAPAMHTCTGAFYTHPESKVVADEYGILITTSHCEPLLFNNASPQEWDKNTDGEWNYRENGERIRQKLDNRVKEAAQYENIYTLAMRGLHDEGMRGNLTPEERVEVLATAMADQRDILKRHISTPIEDIPQIFVPYKEALDVYENGLKVPDEVTLVWVDDNYGYLKRLSDPEEQKRSGRTGVYYHTSYLGAPHDYLWLNTTPPALMYEELKKAYDTGADRYWLLNVGDIKPCELGMATFFDMAWDINRFSPVNINSHQAEYASRLFGITDPEMKAGLQQLLSDYYRLAWSRKPEFMGWEREWDMKELERLADTEYSFSNYNDAQQRLADYAMISDKADAMLRSLPEAYRPAFFETVAYPAMASCQMNRKFLMAQLNHELLQEDDKAGVNWAAREARQAYDSIQALNMRYNSLLDGKWKGMMDLAPGWCALYQNMPQVTIWEGIKPVESAKAKVEEKKYALEGCTVINLSDMARKKENGRTISIIEGMGYDWKCLQMGQATQEQADPTSPDAPRVDYTFTAEGADTVEVTVYSLPFFPLHKGRSTRYGVTVDNAPVQVSENLPKEYSPEWKTQVLQNGVAFKARFAVKKSEATHTLTLTCGDPGMIIQRIIVDWGGLKKTYTGPRL